MSNSLEIFFFSLLKRELFPVVCVSASAVQARRGRKKNEKPDFPIRFVEFVMNLKWSGWVNNVRVDYMDG